MSLHLPRIDNMDDFERMRKFKVHFLLSFSRAGSTLLMAYMRAHSQIETGYEEHNPLFRLVGAMRWRGGYEMELKVPPNIMDKLVDEGTELFVKYFFYKLSMMTGKKMAVLKHPWLAPYILKVARIFHDGKIIVLLRHPYDTLASVVDFRKRDDTAKKMFPADWGDLIRLYKDHMQALLSAKDIVQEDRVKYMKFEDFIENPVPWLMEAYKFYGVRSDEKMVKRILEFGKKDRISLTGRVLAHSKIDQPEDKFVAQLNENQRQVVRNNLSGLCQELKYKEK